MKPRPTCIAILLSGLAMAVPAGAGAQSNDPEAGSPSGTIYEIPLDDARKDAAPRHGGSHGGTASGGSASPIHSDNGFGSSSTVPGTSGTTTASTQSAQSQSSGGAGGSGGSGGSGSNGSGSRGGSGAGGSGGSQGGGKSHTSKKPKASANESQIPVAGVVREAAAGGSPSLWRSGLLVLLGILVAAGLATAARVASRRR
jgi:hypothetical protein